MFHVCQADGRKDSFLCPIGTTFNQQLFVCDWWMNSRCEDTPSFYDLNADLYVSATPPSNGLLRRRSGAQTKGAQSDDQQRSSEVEDTDNFADSPQRAEKLVQKTEQLREKEGVYFDNQVSTKSPQRSSTAAAFKTSTRSARVTTAYGARMRPSDRLQSKTSQLRDYDNWASGQFLTTSHLPH